MLCYPNFNYLGVSFILAVPCIYAETSRFVSKPGQQVNYHDTNKLIRVGGGGEEDAFPLLAVNTKEKTLAIAESHAHQEKTHGAVPGTESEISNPGPISRHTKYGKHGE